MAEEVAKPKRGISGTLARWIGLLGVVAAAAALVLVPVWVDPEALLSNPGEAYFSAQLRIFLMISAVLLFAATGLLVFDRRPLRSPVLIPALALLAVSALSTFFSPNPAHSLYGDRGEGLLSVAAGVLLFFVLAQSLNSRARLRLLLTAATTAAALISIYGIAENYGVELMSGWGNPPFADRGRSSATVGNALTLSAYLTLMMGAATALYLGAASRIGRLAWLLALALIGACWIYAESRGALLGAGAALPLVAFAVRRRMGTLGPLVVPALVLVASMGGAVVVSRALDYSTLSIRFSALLAAYLVFFTVFAWLLERGRTRLALLLPLVAVACVGVALVAAPGPSALSNIGANRGASSGDGDISLQTRLYIWRDAVPMILDRPLLGYGPDNFREPFRPYISRDLQNVIENDEGEIAGLDRAHNHTLQLAATTGLLGLAAYAWLLVSFFLHAYRSSGWALAALAGAALAYVLQLQTAFPSVATDVAFWGLLGASVALVRLHAEESAGERPAEAGAAATAQAHEEDSEETAPVGSGGSRRMRRRRRRGGLGYGEALVAGAVVAVLVALAVPTFAEQRERLVSAEQIELNVELLQSAATYQGFIQDRGISPEAGVYTSTNPIRRLNDRPLVKPSNNVTLRVETTPEGEFTMEAEKRILAGTLRSSYDSSTGSLSAPS